MSRRQQHELTPKMERFALLIVEGEPQSAAYRRVYAADQMADNVVAVEASRLVRHRAVKARIEFLRHNLQRALGCSRGSLLMELDEARELARQQGDVKTLLGITMSKARLLGFLANMPQPRSATQRHGSLSLELFDQDCDAE